jgi:hypothetical protein
VVIIPLEDKTGNGKYRPDEDEKKSDSGASRSDEPTSAGEARKKVAKLVWESAGAITEKLVAMAVKEGQLGQVKYLFEMAGIYPGSSEPMASNPEESPIYNWLKELRLPEGTQDKSAAQNGGSESIL